MPLSAAKTAPAPKTATKTDPAKTTAPKPTPTPVSIPSGFCAAAPEHSITLNEDKLRASGYVACELIAHGGGKAYKLYKADGSTKVMLPAILRMTGFATAGAAPASTPAPAPAPTPAPAPAPSAIPEGFCAPWPDHAIILDEDKLRASGYVACEQVMHNSNKAYKFYKADGSTKIMLPSILTLTGYAKKA